MHKSSDISSECGLLVHGTAQTIISSEIFFDEIIVLAVPWTNIPHSDERSLELCLKWAFSIQTVFNTTIKLHVLKDLCI